MILRGRAARRPESSARARQPDAIALTFLQVENTVCELIAQARFIAQRFSGDPHTSAAVGFWCSARAIAHQARLRWTYGRTFLAWWDDVNRG